MSRRASGGGEGQQHERSQTPSFQNVFLGLLSEEAPLGLSWFVPCCCVSDPIFVVLRRACARARPWLWSRGMQSFPPPLNLSRVPSEPSPETTTKTNAQDLKLPRVDSGSADKVSPCCGHCQTANPALGHEKAAAHGCSASMLELGVSLASGEPGVPKDLPLALSFLTRAVAPGMGGSKGSHHLHFPAPSLSTFCCMIWVYFHLQR